MSTKQQTLLAGLMALLAAALVIGATMIGGIGPSQVIVAPGQGQVGSTTSSASGVLSVLVTDPPLVPAGVTGVYVTYSNLAVHVSGAGNQSGWRHLSDGGSLDLMKIVNISLTVAAVNVPTGRYDMLRFNISSATVTFGGKNYTAFVPSGELTVPIIGGIEVTESKPSATIIDIRPVVMNIGSSSNPEFMIRPSATAFAVPQGQLTPEMVHEGGRFELKGAAWWAQIQQSYTKNIAVSGAELSPRSLNVTVQNRGPATVLRLVVVTPLSTTLFGGGVPGRHKPGAAGGVLPEAMLGSAIFLVERNGTLVPVQLSLPMLFQGRGAGEIANALLDLTGYNLTAGSSVTLRYRGAVTLGFWFAPRPQSGVSQVVPGEQYMVTVIGTEAVASYIVVAGQ
jgi:hypothetical protein